MSSDHPGKVIDPEVVDDEGEIVAHVGNQLTNIVRAEVDGQIATAKAYPRSVAECRKAARDMALLDKDTALKMWYAVPRGGKTIKGPSIRLAEIMAIAWKNIRVGTRIVESNNNYVTCQAVCHDMESNYSETVEKRRRVHPKKGRPVDADDINIAGLAGAAICKRDAILAVVPRVYADIIMREAQQVAVGDAKSLSDGRQAYFTYFAKLGVSKEQVCAAVGAKGDDDIGAEELADLAGFATAIRDGDMKIEDAFPPPEKPLPMGDTDAARALRDKAAATAKEREAASGGGAKPPEERPAPAATQEPAQKEEKKRRAPRRDKVEPLAPNPPAPEAPRNAQESQGGQEAAPVESEPPPGDGEASGGQPEPQPEAQPEREPGDEPPEPQGQADTPKWYSTWQGTIDGLTTWDKAQRELRTLVGLAREATPEHKPLYESLVEGLMDKAVGIAKARGPSLLLVVESVAKSLQSSLSKDSYGYIIDLVAKAKAPSQ